MINKKFQKYLDAVTQQQTEDESSIKYLDTEVHATNRR
jgi:hypothetical protein